ncbi:MAG: PAS domain-containing hybrid sensor histidine kinase/response regulator [Ignavibacteriaceae bacterium]
MKKDSLFIVSFIGLILLGVINYNNNNNIVKNHSIVLNDIMVQNRLDNLNNREYDFDKASETFLSNPKNDYLNRLQLHNDSDRVKTILKFIASNGLYSKIFKREGDSLSVLVNERLDILNSIMSLNNSGAKNKIKYNLAIKRQNVIKARIMDLLFLLDKKVEAKIQHHVSANTAYIKNATITYWVLSSFGLIFIFSFYFIHLKQISKLNRSKLKLQKSEERFSKAFLAGPDGIAITRLTDGKIIEMNDVALKILNYTKEDVINKTTEEICLWANPDDREIFTDKLIKYGEYKDFETIWLTKDKRFVPSRVSTKKIDIDGEPHAITIAQDLTLIKENEKKLIESETKFKDIFNNAPVSIWEADFTELKNAITDLEKSGINNLREYILQNPSFISKAASLIKIVNINKQTLQIYKTKNKEDILGSVEKIFVPESYGTFKELIIAFSEGKETFEIEWLNKSFTGDKIQILLKAIFPKFDSDFNNVILTIIDITVLKKAEREIIIAKEKAEEMYRAKSNFFANMSHELRTPLIGILGYSDFLKEELANTQLLEMVETINTSGNRLLNTLNLILQISKIDAEKLDVHFGIFDVIGIVKEVINLWKVKAEEKGIYLNLDTTSEKLKINLDKQFLYEILNNLVSNAIKYTKHGGIIVKLFLIEEEQKLLLKILVIDSGIGISKENQKVIFHEFRQASEGLSRSFEGTGLGLTISKKLTEKLGGSITVESEVGSGSIFIVTLPVNYTSEPQQVFETTKEENLAKETNNYIENQNNHLTPEILLVEDDPVSTSVTTLYLKNYYKIDSCTKAEVAIQMTKQKKYIAVLMDINLGYGKTGLDAAREIKLLKGYTKVPIIALTAFAMDGDREEFIKAGCTHYLSKPFTKSDLLNILQDALSSNITI